MRAGISLAMLAVAAIWTFTTNTDPVLARALLLAFSCIVLWLSEWLPPFVPTMVLLGGAPLLLGRFGSTYEFSNVLEWAADPVLVLFFGGFVLGVSAQRHGLDARVASSVVRASSGSPRRLVGLILLSTAALSMWMSNIAAAAVMVAMLRPMVDQAHDRLPARALLLAVAVGANLGGIATPIGTGPNALAIAAASPNLTITFLEWMGFAVPLTLGMLFVAYVLLTVRYRVRDTPDPRDPAVEESLSPGARSVLIVMGCAIAAWVSEPLHGIPSAIVALMLAVVIFASRLLRPADLGAIDWSTLGLIAGGISLGRLLEAAGALSRIPLLLEMTGVPPSLHLAAFLIASAVMSAVMSNTATAAFMIPMAATVVPSPATPVLVAIACSFGMPFAISTPPNAMVHGQAGVTSRDLLWIGLPLMVLGCAVLVTTGPVVLAWMGIR